MQIPFNFFLQSREIPAIPFIWGNIIASWRHSQMNTKNAKFKSYGRCPQAMLSLFLPLLLSSSARNLRYSLRISATFPPQLPIIIRQLGSINYNCKLFSWEVEKQKGRERGEEKDRDSISAAGPDNATINATNAMTTVRLLIKFLNDLAVQQVTARRTGRRSPGRRSSNLATVCTTNSKHINRHLRRMRRVRGGDGEEGEFYQDQGKLQLKQLSVAKLSQACSAFSLPSPLTSSMPSPLPFPLPAPLTGPLSLPCPIAPHIVTFARNSIKFCWRKTLMCFAALCNTGSGGYVIQYQGYINYNYTYVREREKQRGWWEKEDRERDADD